MRPTATSHRTTEVAASRSARYLIWALVLVIPGLAAGEAVAFERLDAITLNSGEDNLFSAVIDPAGEFAYFGTDGNPGRVVKIDLETFERVDVITLEDGENTLRSAVIDPVGEFAYFGTFTSPGRVVKIDLETFERVGAITLEDGEIALVSAVIDPAGNFAYFGTQTAPGRVVKIDLETFERSGAITLEGDENQLALVVIDPAGEFAYYGTFLTFPGQVVKIDLETFERVGTITLSIAEDSPLSAVIDPAGDFAYFGTISFPGRVVKIDLETFERVDAITLETGENSLYSAVIDPAGEFAYFGTDTFPGRVIKIDLETFERVGAITLNSGEDGLHSAVIDPAGDLAYFGTLTGPGRVVKIGPAFSPVALEADFLSLDSDGNGVFEPGEQVDVAPAWRNNADDLIEALLGSATDLTGPAGTSYEIVSAAASYGTPLPGEVASCRDDELCYQMEIGPAGASRPATHWDATFEETLANDIVKTWTLHLGDSFLDVARTSPFYPSIEALLHHAVTGGCTVTEYCPGEQNTRGQMAVFLLKAAEGESYAPAACVEGEGSFADVPFDSPLCPWIEELAARAITSGCGGDNYCPSAAVTRAQMAVFLLKTVEGSRYTPPECTGEFTDVACASPFAAWVEELAGRGITSGCSLEPLAYCPAAPVTRQQMAVFLTKSFGLTLYGP